MRRFRAKLRNKRGLESDDLAGVHDVERIERVFDRAHAVERRLAALGFQVFHLALADAVLAGAGAVHRQRPLHQAFEEQLHARDFRLVVEIDQNADVEIAVADVTDDGADQLARGNVALGFGDAFGKPRDRHANVARQRLRAGTQRDCAQ